MSNFLQHIFTPPGKLRLTAIGTGVFAIVLSITGYYIHSQHRHTSTVCTPKHPFCPVRLATSTALGLIIIAWLFSILMLVCVVSPSWAGNPNVHVVDTVGHMIASYALLAAAILILSYVGYWSLECEINYLGKYCVQHVLLYVYTNEDEPEWIGPQKVYGRLNIIWVFAALFALVQTVVCYGLFSVLRKEQQVGAIVDNLLEGAEEVPSAYQSHEEGYYQEQPLERNLSKDSLASGSI